MADRPILTLMLFSLLALVISPTYSSDWSNPNSPQYHIQTDEGNERYFRYQTVSGQYRKEKRLEDGTVVGTYAWIDDDGFLRQRDYIADNAGYRILKTKNLYVGRNTPINQAIKAAKKVAPGAGTLVKTGNVPQSPSPTPLVDISPNSIPSSTPSYLNSYPTTTARPYYSTTVPPFNYRNNQSDICLPALKITPQPPPTPAPQYEPYPWEYSGNPQYEHYKKPGPPSSYTFQNGPTYPIDNRGQTYTGANQIGNGYDPQYPLYDGVSVTNDGFRYYIPRAYHEEQTLPNDKRSGSFGYIDPFGIRRVIYYNTAPGTGFQHRKNNRYVGFDATPYDPRPY